MRDPNYLAPRVLIAIGGAIAFVGMVSTAIRVSGMGVPFLGRPTPWVFTTIWMWGAAWILLGVLAMEADP